MPLLELHALVVRQVDRDRLGARIGVPGHEHDVVRVQVRIRARSLPLEGGWNRQLALEIGQEGSVTLEPPAPLRVLDQDERLVARLEPEQLVLVALDRTDHDVDRVRLHVHPGQVALAVLVGEQRLRPQLEVAGEPRVTRARRRLPQLRRCRLVLRSERLVIGDRDQPTSWTAPHERVLTQERQVGGRRGLHLRGGDVGRIEVGARWLGSDPRDEGPVAVEAVPGADVDRRVPAGGFIRDHRHQRIPGSPRLHPERLVHRRGRLDQQPHDVPVRLREVREVAGQTDGRVLVEARLHGFVTGGSVRRVRSGDAGAERERDERRGERAVRA